MLGVSFDWTITLLVCIIIACQVILEDLIVCAATDMRSDGYNSVTKVVYKGEVRTNRHIDLMGRMQL